MVPEFNDEWDSKWKWKQRCGHRKRKSQRTQSAQTTIQSQSTHRALDEQEAQYAGEGREKAKGITWRHRRGCTGIGRHGGRRAGYALCWLALCSAGRQWDGRMDRVQWVGDGGNTDHVAVAHNTSLRVGCMKAYRDWSFPIPDDSYISVACQGFAHRPWC